MFYNLFSEIINPDIFQICGKKVDWNQIKLRIDFTLKGEEENQSVLDFPLHIAYLSLFHRMVRRKWDKVVRKKEKIRKRHFKESMSFRLKLEKKEEIFSFLNMVYKGRVKRKSSFRRVKKDVFLIPNLTFFRPFPFVDPETILTWEWKKEPPIRVHFPVKRKNKNLFLLRFFIS